MCWLFSLRVTCVVLLYDLGVDAVFNMFLLGIFGITTFGGLIPRTAFPFTTKALVTVAVIDAIFIGYLVYLESSFSMKALSVAAGVDVNAYLARIRMAVLRLWTEPGL